MKVLKFLAIAIAVILVIGVAAVAVFDTEKPFATLKSNGVTVEVYGARQAKRLASSTTAEGARIEVDDNVLIFGNGRLSINGETQNVGSAKKINVRLRNGKLIVETE